MDKVRGGDEDSGWMKWMAVEKGMWKREGDGGGCDGVWNGVDSGVMVMQ